MPTCGKVQVQEAGGGRPCSGHPLLPKQQSSLINSPLSTAPPTHCFGLFREW